MKIGLFVSSKLDFALAEPFLASLSCLATWIHPKEFIHPYLNYMVNQLYFVHSAIPENWF